jgi:hypothetical protein
MCPGEGRDPGRPLNWTPAFAGELCEDRPVDLRNRRRPDQSLTEQNIEAAFSKFEN